MKSIDNEIRYFPLNPYNQVPEFLYLRLLCDIAFTRCRRKQLKTHNKFQGLPICKFCEYAEQCNTALSDLHLLAVCNEQERVKQILNFKEIGEELSKEIIWYQDVYLDCSANNEFLQKE